MAGAHVAVRDLDERRVQEFFRARRRRGLPWRRLVRALRLLLEWLRAAGAVPTVPIKAGDSLPTLLQRYEEHLRKERGLAESTVTGFVSVAQAFVVERLDGGAAVVPSGLLATVR